jgi:DNA-directed RNA polymerase specialized sigma24 family protein
MSTLTATGMEMLLARLDPDQAAAADKYEVLRLKLVKCVLWKGCPDSWADVLADRVLDRLASKIEHGTVIENINAYSLEILRFVWLEYLRKEKEDIAGDDGFPEIAVQPDIPILEDPDARMNCLRVCLNEVVPDATDRAVIVGYYDTDPGLKNKEHRKVLAEKIGLTMTTLKVKACRIRARLEHCINECVARAAAVTKMP